MAEIFRAEPVGIPVPKPFVVKRIRPEKASSPSSVRMFCEEARLSALLRHPNIVETYDFGCIDGTYFLAMEYLEGQTLSSVLQTLRRRRRAVPPAVAALIAREVARALDYVHHLRGENGQLLGLVHRDVTPSNIMLLSSGGVKVLDFGIAKATAERRTQGRKENTQLGLLKGKMGYLAPEHIRAESVDARSDLFTLGIVLWEMLVGDRLFGGTSEHESARQVMAGPRALPSGLRPEVPAALDAIVSRCLARDPEARWSSAAELTDALDTFLDGSPCTKGEVAHLLAELADAPARQAA